MSFIFEALRKQGNNESGNRPVVPSETHQASVNHMQQPLNGSSTQQAFSWGLLLALAILGAVVIGFVLGRMSVSTGSEKAMPISKSQNVVTQASQQVVRQTAQQLPKPEQPTLNQQAQSSGQVVSQVGKSAPVKKIAAEHYFDNPPVSSKGTQQARQEPIIVGATPPSEQMVEVADNARKTELFEAELIDQSEGVSDKLMARFQQAITDTQQAEAAEQRSEEVSNQVPSLSQQPQWLQDSVPRLNFSMHMFSSAEADSWIRVNGQDKFVGDTIADDIKLVAIEPQYVVLELEGQQFSLPALSTW